MNKGYVALWILGFILLVMDLSIVVSVLKKGDERRQMIVWKSSTYTFSVLIGMLIIECVTKLVVTGFDLASNDFNSNTSPFSLLTILALIYFISLKYNKKKYGD